MQWITEETGWILPEESGVLPEEQLSGSHAPETLLRFGAGLARTAQRCMIGYDGHSAHAAASAMLIAGAAAKAGGSVILVPDCTPVELGPASAAGGCGAAVFAGEQSLRMYAGGLLPLTLRQEQTISDVFSRQPVWMQNRENGPVSDGKALRLLYPAQIAQMLPETLPFQAECSAANSRIRTLSGKLFRGGRGEAVTFQFSSDGQRVSLYSERCGWIFYEKLLLMLCQARLRRGEDVALPYWVPHIAEQMAAEHGRRILRYASRSDGSDLEARALARAQGFTLDGLMLCAGLLRTAAEDEPDLMHWAMSLPPFATVRRILQTEQAAEAALRCGMQTEQTPEGLRAHDPRGDALLRPSRSGKTVTMLVEAASMELASELAGDISGRLRIPPQNPGIRKT